MIESYGCKFLENAEKSWEEIYGGTFKGRMRVLERWTR